MSGKFKGRWLVGELLGRRVGTVLANVGDHPVKE